MANRKPLPDKLNIMAALQEVQTKPMAKEEVNEPARVKSEVMPPEKPAADEIPPSRPAEEVASSTKIEPSEVKAKSTKTKVNLYLESAMKRRTEKIQIELRDIAPDDLAGQVNYSLIVETALQIVFDEFDRTREESKLSREIMRLLRDR